MADLHDLQLPWPQPTRLELPDGLGALVRDEGNNLVRAPWMGERVSVRFSAAGRVRIVNRAGSRHIKKLWQEFGIPPWQRERIPLIYYDEQLIAAMDVFVTAEGQVLADEAPWRLCWKKK